MLSFATPILAAEIRSITVFKDLKVFLLTGALKDRVVVKADGLSRDQIKSANWAMKNVDSGARVKILTPFELGQLKEYADTTVAAIELLEDMGYNAKDMNHPARQLKDSPGWDDGYVFFKMEPQKLIDVENAYKAAHKSAKDKTPPDLTDITRLAASLKAEGGLEKLGEIIAVDLFNGYSDRFYPGGGIFLRKWKAIVNLGNIFIVTDKDNKLVPSGLDFANANSPDWQKPIDDQWSGHLLSDVQRRRQFANDVIDDLEFLFSPIPPTKRAFKSPKPALGNHKEAVQRLIDGMRDGVKKIIISVRARGAKRGSLSKVEDGLLARYNFIQRDRTDI